MDLNQQRLTKNEWDNLERPIEGDEYRILSFIYKSNCNTDNVINKPLLPIL